MLSKQEALVAKLKKKVKLLERREEEAKDKLRAALLEMRKLGETYKHKLLHKIHVLKNKVADARASTYARLTANIEKQIMKDVDAKMKAIKLAIEKIEKAAKPSRKVKKKKKAKKKKL